MAATKKAEAAPFENKALALAVSQIEKQYGKGAIVRLGSQEAVDVPAISTGSLGLDLWP
jgi:recombination protein RecA